MDTKLNAMRVSMFGYERIVKAQYIKLALSSNFEINISFPGDVNTV